MFRSRGSVTTHTHMHTHAHAHASCVHDERRTEPARLNLLKRYACKWHISLGVSLAAGMAAARQLQPLVPAALG